MHLYTFDHAGATKILASADALPDDADARDSLYLIKPSTTNQGTGIIVCKASQLHDVASRVWNEHPIDHATAPSKQPGCLVSPSTQPEERLQPGCLVSMPPQLPPAAPDANLANAGSRASAPRAPAPSGPAAPAAGGATPSAAQADYSEGIDTSKGHAASSDEAAKGHAASKGHAVSSDEAQGGGQEGAVAGESKGTEKVPRDSAAKAAGSVKLYSSSRRKRARVAAGAAAAGGGGSWGWDWGWGGLREGEEVVLQEYVLRPMLIGRRKFDMRCFCLIASVQPLLVLRHQELYLRRFK